MEGVKKDRKSTEKYTYVKTTSHNIEKYNLLTICMSTSNNTYTIHDPQHNLHARTLGRASMKIADGGVFCHAHTLHVTHCIPQLYCTRHTKGNTCNTYFHKVSQFPVHSRCVLVLRTLTCQENACTREKNHNSVCTK